MTNAISEPMSTAARNKTAAINGLILGIIYVAIKAGINQTAEALVLYAILNFTGYLVFLGILWFMLVNLRKANGGYIELREAFGATFVTVLIAGLLSVSFQYLYTFVIDPGYTDRVLDATVKTLEKSGAPDDKIDQMVDQIQKAKVFRLSDVLMGYFSGVIVDCLFGLVVSLIVKKSRPVFENLS